MAFSEIRKDVSLCLSVPCQVLLQYDAFVNYFHRKQFPDVRVIFILDCVQIWLQLDEVDISERSFTKFNFDLEVIKLVAILSPYEKGSCFNCASIYHLIITRRF